MIRQHTNNADQIVPRLWLGNFHSSQDTHFIRKNNINVIINCTKDLPFTSISGIYKYRVPVHDNLQTEEIITMSKWIGKILPIISEHYQLGRTILIHCAAGMQRSAIIVLCFLCSQYGVDPKMAFIKMKNIRPIVFSPYMNFGLSFRLYFGEQIYSNLIQ